VQYKQTHEAKKRDFYFGFILVWLFISTSLFYRYFVIGAGHAF